MLANAILVIVLVIAAIGTVMTSTLLRSAILLALTSVVTAVIIYQLGCPLAAVIELSVCAGLIPVIFVSVIGLTRRVSKDEMPQRKKEQLKSFWLLPILLFIVWILMYHMDIKTDFVVRVEDAETIRHALWVHRSIDVLGQIAVLLAGAFGVAAIIKERKK